MYGRLYFWLLCLRTCIVRYGFHDSMSFAVGTGTGAAACAAGAVAAVSGLLQPAASAAAITSRATRIELRMTTSSGGARGEMTRERVLHRRVDETGNVAAEARDLAHERRRNEAVLLGRRQEQRLRLRDEVAVHAGELELVFEVRHGAQAAQDHAGADLAHERREQRVEPAHLDVLHVAQRLL